MSKNINMSIKIKIYYHFFRRKMHVCRLYLRKVLADYAQLDKSKSGRLPTKKHNHRLSSKFVAYPPVAVIDDII